ncbi:hypothetical protein QR680_002988 [Steinernema hermaphroditum]|uniref:EGF-like domain-containing protein n=1 Tax=Steinernema hermaphroditum TaxID=289476 RepID=A0AA39H528_9BILA|nr:hypothetical protein QR680_002988 [Steinernema hermaphroditum]
MRPQSPKLNTHEAPFLNHATAVRIIAKASSVIHRRRRATGSAATITVKRAWYAIFCIGLLAPSCDGCATNRLRSQPPFHTPLTLDQAKIERNCTAPLDRLWCHNGGICREVYESTGFKAICLCREHFIGRRCETIYNAYLTESALQQRLETAALPILITLLILLTCVLSCAFYMFRRDARNYSIGSPNTRISDCI